VGRRSAWLAIEPEEVSGRRVVPATAWAFADAAYA
jgi:hypothetical protein